MFKKLTRNNMTKAFLGTAKIAMLGLLMFSTNSAIAKQGHIELTSQAQKVITVKNEQGQEVKKLIPATKVLPGEVVQYTNTFKNISREKADGIGITNPIPTHTVYIPNTATGAQFDITYSIDGGKKWGVPNSLKVKGQDGKMHTATPADYTHIRWKYKKSLNPKEVKRVSYQVRLL